MTALAWIFMTLCVFAICGYCALVWSFYEVRR
jgi:hypothetical protein